jgi:hypothetical protein
VYELTVKIQRKNISNDLNAGPAYYKSATLPTKPLMSHIQQEFHYKKMVLISLSDTVHYQNSTSTGIGDNKFNSAGVIDDEHLFTIELRVSAFPHNAQNFRWSRLS